MVCKEDVVSWFKELRGHKRIDVMCSLLNMCLPFELRYLGTCLEELGKRDFHDLRETETRANNIAELADLQCISDKRTQRKLTLYLSLLQTSNHACSNGLYKILANLDFSDLNLTTDSADENPFDELLLLYTLAANHPAFTYEQKSVLVNILLKLQEEEDKMFAAKQPLGIGLLYVKPPMQACVPCPPTEDRQDVISHCSGMAIPPTHPTVAANDPKTRITNPGNNSSNSGSVPPGMAVAHSLGLPPPEQLGYVQVAAFPSPVGNSTHQQHIPWPHPAAVAPGPIVVCEMPVAPATTAPNPAEYPPSPLVSRQSSPSQSGSPSRAGSPAAPPAPSRPAAVERIPGSSSNGTTGFKGPPVQRRARPNCAPEPLPLQRNLSRKGSVEPPDGVWETITKEIPGIVKKYSPEELKQKCDEELKEMGIPSALIAEVRAVLTKLSNTNGLSNLERRGDLTSSSNRRKPESMDSEVPGERKGVQQQQLPPQQQHQHALRRWEGAPVMYPPQPLVHGPSPCLTCFVPMTSTARFQQQQLHQHHPGPMYCMAHKLQTLVLEDGHGRSGGSSGGGTSDSSSNGHSPPDTPSVPNAPHWDRSYPSKDVGVAERWSPGCEDHSEKDQRRPQLVESDKTDMPEIVPVVTGPVGGRRPGGVGRGKSSNPPGLQTLPRGRGPSAVVPEKGLPGARQSRPSDGSGVSIGPQQQQQPPPQQQQQQPQPQQPPQQQQPQPQPQQQPGQPPLQDNRKVFTVPAVTAADVVHVAPYPPSTSPQYLPNGASRVPDATAGAVPYQPAAGATTAGFVPTGHFAGLHRSGTVFPGFSSYSLRPTFPFSHNGELVYQYHGPQTPPPPPPHPTTFLPTPVVYSSVMPPPKVSCYNCGSQNHHAADCKEATIDEITKPSQYRLDYAPYQKQAECSTEK